MSRFEALVGLKLASRELERQQVEALVRRQVVNRMTDDGARDAENGTRISGLIRLCGPGGGHPCVELE